MRILLTTETFESGWAFARGLCDQLLQRGHELALVGFGRRLSHEQQAWVAERSSTYRRSFQFVASNAPLEWMQDNEFVLTQGAGVLHHVARNFQPDLLHSSQFCFGALGLEIPKLITAHHDAFSWIQACRGGKPEHTRWMRQYRTLVTDGLNGADAVVSPTRWMALSLKQQFATLPASYVIHDGRAITAAPPSHLRILQAITTGRLWDETKNIRMLESVLSPVPIYVVGERKHHETVSPKQLGKAILLGGLPESTLQSLYARSKLYVDVSVYAPSGLDALEAALCGCAVLAHDIPSTREIWGDAAFYFRNARELSSILHQLNRNSEQLSEMQRRSYERASKLTPDRMADGYEAIYEMLLAPKLSETSVPAEQHHIAAHAA
ncbi:MAG TPA: glycosyltransferase family 4 protein [Candidatus Aquilonibacter sp.]|nr:glycosyltransferase family 4 protein [Candidatus Aquilonibacter sp.]